MRFATVETGLPVSTAVEDATLVTKLSLPFFALARWGFVFVSDFVFIKCIST